MAFTSERIIAHISMSSTMSESVFVTKKIVKDNDKSEIEDIFNR